MAQRTRAARMGGEDAHTARMAVEAGHGPDGGTVEADGGEEGQRRTSLLLPTCLPTYQSVNLPMYLPTYLPINRSIYQPIYLYRA